jgi:hypothetical protein
MGGGVLAFVAATVEAQMTKLVALGCIAAAGLSIAGAASALNPQPLPPRCIQGARCDPMVRGAHTRNIEMVRRARCRVVHHQRICRR